MEKKFPTKIAMPLLALASLLFYTTTFAQSLDDFPAFGIYSQDDINLKKVDFDKQANAVVLFDIARSYYDDEYHLITDHRTRIKILNTKGLDQADIAIDFYSKDDFEYIANINGTTTNFDASGEHSTKLSSKTVFTKQINAYRSQRRFSMPDVKVGSIIEYSYTSNMKHYGGLDEWVFQKEIPVLKSAYDLTLMPNTEFAYKVLKSKNLPIKIDPRKNSGSIYFEMDNIAGLHDEPYMDSRKNNLQQVTFQLAAYTQFDSKINTFTKWEDVAPELLKQPEFGGQLNKNLSNTDEFIAKTKTLSSALEKVKATYAFVQKRVGWDGYTTKYSIDGVKKVWDKGTGKNGEINLIFVNLLQSVGVTAYPMLAADRWRGKVDISYPFVDQFHNTVAYIEIPHSTALVIDAADKETPINMMPYSLLNTYGYIVDKKKKGLILLEDKNHYLKNMVTLSGEISADGVLLGSAQTFSYDYERAERKNFYNKNGKQKFISEYFTADYANVHADSLEIDNLNDDTLNLEQRVNFKQTLNTSGEYVFVDCHLFSGIGKNPFTDDVRFSDVNFGSARVYLANQIINLPANYSVDALPKNIRLITPDTAFTLIRKVEVQENQLLTQVKFEIRNSYYSVEDYSMLKEFFKKMYDILDEQVVLKKKN
ncbi:DUF3857 domain-containing protein [Chitinophagaceae bacterium 26-R-25]|nr:DUF3857 domain-containing protein [Chitinophagaceae bacterium 26-R-25]